MTGAHLETILNQRLVITDTPRTYGFDYQPPLTLSPCTVYLDVHLGARWDLTTHCDRQWVVQATIRSVVLSTYNRISRTITRRDFITGTKLPPED